MKPNTDTVIELAKNEMREAQNERGSLMRWKLILVSAIGAAALGFSREETLTNSELALCLIPFCCVYVDILCRNLSLRTKMISVFLHQNGDPLEDFYWRYKRVSGGSLESLALQYSTRFLSFIIMPVGIIAYFNNPFDQTSWLNWTSALFYISGILGIALSFFIEAEYRRKKNSMNEITESEQTSKRKKRSA